jgi:predicted kinase
MNNLYIPVGIPGCGKSTWGDNMGFVSPKLRTHEELTWTTGAEPPGIQRVLLSSDALREHLGDINDQSRNKSVFDLLYGFVNYHLGYNGQDVYVDATNLDRRSRDQLSEIAKRYSAATHLILFNNPTEAIDRNRRRDRKVPEDVMLRMLGKLERARIEIIQESYDSVTKITSVR